MAESLRILILEDNPADAELVPFELEEAGFLFTSKVVTTEEDFIRGLREFSPDLILSDYDLPKYNGALALAEAKSRCPDIPFILVTGAVTEDRAIDILTQGAKDYVLKARLQQRLVPAVRRALAEAEEHRARKRAEADLREAHKTLGERVKIRTAELEAEIAARRKIEETLLESERRLSLAYQAAKIGAFEWNVRTGVNIWTPELEAMYGLARGEFGRTQPAWEQLVHPEDRAAASALINQTFETGKTVEGEWRVVWRDGSVHWIAGRFQAFRDAAGKPLRLSGVNMDITGRKRAEDALKESEDRYRALFEGMTEGFAIHEIITDEQDTPVDYRFLDINPAFERLTGLKREDVVGKTHNEVLPGNDPKWVRIYGAVALTGTPAQFENYSEALKRRYEVTAYRPAPRQFAVIFMDITGYKRAEEAP